MEEPLILAVETSSRVGSVALARGSVLLAETLFSAPLQHSAELFPAMSGLLNRFDCAPEDIAQVHIAVGPGSFTGLRIAVTTAKMAHLANAAAIVTVNSLDVIAANVGDGPPGRPLQNSADVVPDCIATLLDAKRGEFYAAVYQRMTRTEGTREACPDGPGYEIPASGNKVWCKTVPDGLLTADDLIGRVAVGRPLALLGDGLLYHRDRFQAEGVHILDEKYWSPRASSVHRLGYQKAWAGLFADALTLTPFYLRAPHVTLKRQS
jgi:tRNA threonylcarbamoyl adenosine modification protein YeaZ